MRPQCATALGLFVAASAAVGAPPHVQLVRALLADYDKNAKPVRNQSHSVLVQVESKLFSILGVDEAEETMTYAHWFYLRWTDMLLQWDPAEYGGIGEITIRKEQLWIPDILIYEGMTRELQQSDEQMFVRITSDGAAYLATPEIVKIHCHFDVSQFPYDRQNCSNTYASWMYAGEDVVLKPIPNSDRTGVFKKHSEWDLLDVDAKLLTIKYKANGLDRRFYEVYFHFIIERRPFYYIVSLVIPIYAIAQVTIVGIFTPHNAQHERETKVELGLTGMLSMSVMLLVVSELTPRSATDYPLLGVFMLQELLIIGVAAIFATVILHLHSRAALGGSPPPRCLLRVTGCQRRAIVSNGADGKNGSNNGKYSNPTVSTRIKDSDTNTELLALVHSLYQILRGVRQYVAAKQGHSDERKLWARVCGKLDAYCLVLFLFVNTVFFVFFLLAPLG